MSLALSGWRFLRLVSRPSDQDAEAKKNTHPPASGGRVPSKTSLGWLFIMIAKGSLYVNG